MDFAINFPEEGTRRPLWWLKATWGADWFYRRLLENQLSVFEHFRGKGRTQNELIDQDGRQPEHGMHEYVGPHMNIKDLPEMANINLGKLAVEVEQSR